MGTYYTILTKKGQEKLTAAIALGNNIQLTRFEIGDGGGSVYDPNADQVELVNTVYGKLPNAAPINSVSLDEGNANWLVLECIVPKEDLTDGDGFYVRELGIFDGDGDLFAIANYPETYMPSLNEGGARDLLIHTFLEVGNVESVALSIDSNAIIATHNYVERNTLALSQNLSDVPDKQAGVGNLISGGEAGQVLTKKTATPGDVDWVEPAKQPSIGQLVPGGGGARQVLTKKTDADGDVTWEELFTNGVYQANVDAPLGSMHVDNLGKVGIGTSNPTKELEVNGNIQASKGISSQGGIVRRDFFTWNNSSAGSYPSPIHLKTNIPAESNIMFRILIEGYNYGSGLIINSDIAGYTWSGAPDNLTNMTATNYAPGVGIAQYYSSDRYLVIKLDAVGNYRLGLSVSAWFTNANGLGFDISIMEIAFGPDI